MNDPAPLREALTRIACLTPGAANASTAWDLHLTVAAIANDALAALPTDAVQPVGGERPETDMEHIARDMRDGTFPTRSERKLVPDRSPEWWLERARREPDVIISAGLPAVGGVDREAIAELRAGLTKIATIQDWPGNITTVEEAKEWVHAAAVVALCGPKATAALYAAAQDVGSGWRSIETAPKDGTVFEALYDDGSQDDGVCWMGEGRCCMLGSRAGSMPDGWVSNNCDGLPVGNGPHITHWRPLALYATAPTAGSDAELEADMERDLTESDHEAIERGLRTIRAFDAVRSLRSVLSDTMARQHNGYDWNADPDGMTLRQSEAVAHADRVNAPTAGSGWVMVPREPTEAMLDAGRDAAQSANAHFASWADEASSVWSAMITAAPTVGGE